MTTPKNPLKTIAVFNEVHRRLPNATLTWCGDGNLRGAIEEKIAECGLTDSVDMVGVTDKVADYLKNSDYFLLPSLFEGLSIALAEAQAAGLDCFISDTCSKLSDCGKCIYIPLQASDSEWADRILQHVGERKLQLDNERMSKFDIHSMAEELEYFYLDAK